MILNWKETPLGWQARLSAVFPETGGGKLVSINCRVQIDVRVTATLPIYGVESRKASAQFEVRGDKGKVSAIRPYGHLVERAPHKTIQESMWDIELWCSIEGDSIRLEEIRL